MKTIFYLTSFIRSTNVLIPINPQIPTNIYTILEPNAPVPPNMVATRSKPNSPINPQFKAPIKKN